MILYLHGFLSSGNSHKGQWVKRAFEAEGIKVLTPTYPIVSPQASVAAIDSVVQHSILNSPNVKNGQAWCVFGSSMGGFYGRYIAQRYGVPVGMINPALTPKPILSAYLGEHDNPATGERFCLDEGYLTALEPYHTHVDANQPSLLLLDKDDEVIPYQWAYEAYHGTGEVCVFDGGNHAFQHLDQAWPKMKQFVEQYVTRKG
ncbi:YqiA/YcfP family alpha/beta fold hydrolase [Hydrogenovibrio thermophilus]|uniref:Esterase n=1 Tax=Hydrogenovibrio thermophilus TaxID=265883 RepID=A0A410H399_9GAMM|nr:YqiA/YcfP family alpha/beta fold hydrolase [Hydrogenovibrio thermophilus]QAB15405.1 hypothetical protein EPV75_06890 [Hydrogenovibrio thermophilus]